MTASFLSRSQETPAVRILYKVSTVAGPNDIGRGKIFARSSSVRMNSQILSALPVAMTTWASPLVCARCHDHKFDPVSQVDFFSMQSVFEGVKLRRRPIQLEISKKKRGIFRTESQIEKIEAELSKLRSTGKSSPRFVWMDDRTQFVTHHYKKRGSGKNPKVKTLALRMTLEIQHVHLI